jgi:uncharacterized membrane protein
MRGTSRPGSSIIIRTIKEVRFFAIIILMSHEHNDSSHHNSLSPARLETFSDGVMAIIITITVLELKIPLGAGFSSLVPIIPLFIAYAVSFQTVGTYWNNHHHLLRATNHVSAGIMWANLNLLFWLSLIPFCTGWIGENNGGNAPTVLYSAILLFCSISYSLLQMQVVKHSEKRDKLYMELIKSPKGIVSVACYSLAVLAGFYNPIISDSLIVLVALMWFIPDRRIEKYL